jgi:hypothetical protein
MISGRVEEGGGNGQPCPVCGCVEEVGLFRAHYKSCEDRHYGLLDDTWCDDEAEMKEARGPSEI